MSRRRRPDAPAGGPSPSGPVDPDVARFAAALREQARRDAEARRREEEARRREEEARAAAARLEQLRRAKADAAERLKQARRHGTAAEVAAADAAYREALAALEAAEEAP